MTTNEFIRIVKLFSFSPSKVSRMLVKHLEPIKVQVLPKVKSVLNKHRRMLEPIMVLRPMQITILPMLTMLTIVQQIVEQITRIAMPTTVTMQTIATTTIPINQKLHRIIILQLNRKQHQNQHHLVFKCHNRVLIHQRFDWISMIEVTMFINMLRINLKINWILFFIFTV